MCILTFFRVQFGYTSVLCKEQLESPLSHKSMDMYVFFWYGGVGKNRLKTSSKITFFLLYLFHIAKIQDVHKPHIT